MSPAERLTTSPGEIPQRNLPRAAIAKNRRGHVDHGLELCRGRVRARFLFNRSVTLSGAVQARSRRACRPWRRRLTRDRQQYDQRVARNDKGADAPACANAPAPHFIRAHAARSRLCLRLRQAFRSRVQGTQQFVTVLRGRIQYRGRDTDVVFLRLCKNLCGNYRLTRRRLCPPQSYRPLDGLFRQAPLPHDSFPVPSSLFFTAIEVTYFVSLRL